MCRCVHPPLADAVLRRHLKFIMFARHPQQRRGLPLNSLSNVFVSCPHSNGRNITPSHLKSFHQIWLCITNFPTRFTDFLPPPTPPPPHPLPKFLFAFLCRQLNATGHVSQRYILTRFPTVSSLVSPPTVFCYVFNFRFSSCYFSELLGCLCYIQVQFLLQVCTEIEIRTCRCSILNKSDLSVPSTPKITAG